uniref:Transposable element P transposase-like GTP-binding insertion domain-containing protein n=1 Tax=Lepeophtheirus salmonis TaxID=72036 RepID=A0A0K2SY07_LEPSM
MFQNQIQSLRIHINLHQIDDTLARAEFILIHDEVFDILNSRSMKAPSYKKILNKKHFHFAESIFL